VNDTMTVAITVRGRLSDRLAGAFDGLTASRGPHAAPFVGTVADQAPLHGLLARVRDLGLELQCITVARPADPHNGRGRPGVT
jgi:hypothetical protein